jgi:hypothetical protein
MKTDITDKNDNCIWLFIRLSVIFQGNSSCLSPMDPRTRTVGLDFSESLPSMLGQLPLSSGGLRARQKEDIEEGGAGLQAEGLDLGARVGGLMTLSQGLRVSLHRSP